MRWFGPHSAAVLMAVLSFLPALAILLLQEPPRPQRHPAELFSAMWREVWGTASSRRGWTGILFCLAPVSTPALLDLFSAVADDYGARPATVEWTMGYGSGLLTALGALLGGLVLDRIDRRRAYLASGVMIALVDLGMRLAPLSETTYIAGTLVYSLVAGLCFAAFSAMILENIGEAGSSAAAQYTLFDAAGNLATSYLAWLDGVGYDWFKARHGVGAPGLLATDAGMNLAGVAGLCLMMWLLSGRRRLTPQADRLR
jgi:predicted MFS family arabinose efflux permease